LMVDDHRRVEPKKPLGKKARKKKQSSKRWMKKW
jgi:ribosomal protein S9